MSLTHIFAADDKILQTNLHPQTRAQINTEVTSADKPLTRTHTCINPVVNATNRKTSMAKLQNWLFEDDVTPLADQVKAAQRLTTTGPVALAIHSGGKSVHLVVSCSDTFSTDVTKDEQLYKAVWDSLCKIIEAEGLKIDKAGRRTQTLFRTPDVTINGRVQPTLYTGSLVNNTFLRQLVTYTPNIKVREPSGPVVNSLQDFEKMLELKQHANLRGWLKFPNWIEPVAGNYHIIFRLTLWAIDETNVSYDTLINFFHANLQKHFTAKHYFKDYTIGITGAYKFKGLL